jgi:hypothetical protein
MTTQIKSKRKFMWFLMLISLLVELIFFIIGLAFSLTLPTIDANAFWFLFVVLAFKGPIASIILAGFQNQKIAPQVIGCLIGLNHGVVFSGFFVLPLISNQLIGIGSFIIFTGAGFYFGGWASVKIAQRLERFITV